MRARKRKGGREEREEKGEEMEGRRGKGRKRRKWSSDLCHLIILTFATALDSRQRFRLLLYAEPGNIEIEKKVNGAYCS